MVKNAIPLVSSSVNEDDGNLVVNGGHCWLILPILLVLKLGSPLLVQSTDQFHGQFEMMAT